MARDKTIKILRTTKANLETQKTAAGLLAGEPYLITDENRIAVGTGTSAYSEMALKSELPAVPVKATGSEIDTGTDDAKFVTSKSLSDQTVLLKKTGGTMTGALTVPEIVLPSNGQIKLTLPTTDGHATGNITNEFNCGYTSSAVGDLVYLDSSSTWQKCDMDTSAATYSGLLGIALEVKSSGNALKVALPGSFVYCTAFPALTIGSPVYMSDAGAIIVAQPSGADDAIRIIGWAVHADKIFFFPSPDYIVHT